MKRIIPLAALALVAGFFASSNPVSAQTIFSDNFDYYTSSNKVVAAGGPTTNGYSILFGPAAGTSAVDFTAVFGFDYSKVTFPIHIPSAPNSGGSTKGLFLTANKDATGVACGVNLYPTNLVLNGNYVVKFDLWMNWTNTATSTEHVLFGINHSGALTNRVAQVGSDGIFFAMDGDGGQSPTTTGARDYSVFQGRGAGTAPLLLTLTSTPNYNTNAVLGTNFDNADAGFTNLFPAKTIAGYPTTPVGSMGLGWVSVEVRNINTTNVITNPDTSTTTNYPAVVTWLMNNTIIAQYTNTSIYTNGNTTATS